MANFWIKKSISSLLQEADDKEKGLKPTLGATALVLLGIGAIIGAGLFSLTGKAIVLHSGPAVTISFLIAGIGCALAGLCYAEFASMIPVAGSAYTYSYATFGELVAWIIGWDLILEYSVAASMVAISWSGYLQKFLAHYGVALPPELTMSPFQTEIINGVEVTGWVNLPAVFIIVLASLILAKGTKESALVNGIIVVVKVIVVLLFIILGWAYITPENYVPYIPVNTGEFGTYGWSGVIAGAGFIFFAYIGFDAVSTAAQEAKNPKRDMPIGILLSLAICTILYILFAHVLTGLAPYSEFKGKDGIAPVAVALTHTPYEGFQQVIIFAILAGFTSVIMVTLMGQSRVFFSMSKDGLLPKLFSDVHPKFRTPAKSTLLLMVFAGLVAGFIPDEVVGEMASIGTLFAFVLVCFGVLIMRYGKKFKNHNTVDGVQTKTNGFKTPWVPFVPIMGIIFCLGMMVSLGGETWIRLVVWLSIGLLIYFGYGVKKSKLNNPDK